MLKRGSGKFSRLGGLVAGHVALAAVGALRVRAANFGSGGRPGMAGVAIFTHKNRMRNHWGSTAVEPFGFGQMLSQALKIGFG
jgi:hypothetical protein